MDSFLNLNEGFRVTAFRRIGDITTTGLEEPRSDLVVNYFRSRPRRELPGKFEVASLNFGTELDHPRLFLRSWSSRKSRYSWRCIASCSTRSRRAHHSDYEECRHCHTSWD